MRAAALAIVVLAGVGLADECIFELESQNIKVDLTGLAERVPFSVDDGVIRYFYSVCKPLAAQCAGAGDSLMAYAVSRTAPTRCITAYGEASQTAVSLLGSASTGVQVQYKGGSNCASSPNVVSSTTIDIQCDEGGAVAPHGVVVLSGPDDCGFHVQFKSSAGCTIALSPGEVLSPAGLAVLVVVALVAAYCIIGVLYNVCRRGASGVEAIPNVDLWRSCAARLFACCGCAAPSPAKAGYYEDMDVDEPGAAAPPPSAFTDA